jgi:hypothetical protein
MRLGEGSHPPTTLLLKPKTSLSWLLSLRPSPLNHSMRPPLISPLSRTPTVVGSSGLTPSTTRWVMHLPPPSPPRRPPPPPSPFHHPPTTSIPAFSPSSSSDSPLSPLLHPVCDRCEERAMVMDTLHDLKRDLGEIKSITLDLQNRDADRWSRVDTLMSFLQDLRQAIADHDKGKSHARQVYAGPRLGPGF